MRAARGARHLLAVSCVAFAALANAAETALPPGVLILHGNQRALPTGAITDDTLRNVITSELGRRVDLYSEYLDVERFPTDAYGKTNAEFIQRKYGGRNIRVVIPSGPAAYQFMEAYGSKLLPGTPIVQLNVPREFLPGENPPPGFLGAIVDRDPKGTFELAMRLQPAAKRLVIVTGSANQDRVGERRIRAALDRISSGLVVEHLSGLPTPDLLRRLGALAPDTIIYTPGYFMDGGGVVTTPATSVEQMAAVATAPMYGPSANFIGAGAVGGSVFSVEDQAKHIGGIVVKLLNGVAPAAIPPIVMPNVPTVDWRQLRRWGLDEKLLPPGSVVRYRSPTVWEQYRWYILAGFVIFAVQAATIAGLLLQRRHVRGVQAELRLSRQRIEHATNAAQTGIWEWDMVHNNLWVTDQFRLLFGLARDDRVDIGGVIAKIHLADVDTVRKAVALMRTNGGTYDDLEFRVQHTGREDRWIATRGKVVLDTTGKPYLMRGVALDITRRKQMESALQESEARFRSMADAAPVLIWMAGTDKLFTYFNQNWLDFTGRALAREVGDGWFEGIHPEDLARCLETFGSEFDARRKCTMEYRLRAADGEYRWILDTGAPRSAPDGTFLGYIGSCVDITDRKRAGDMLRQERAFLRQVIDIDPNLIFAKNREGRFTLVNQAVADVYCTTVEKLVGKRHEDFGYDPVEAEHFRRVDRQVMDSRQEQFIAEEPITTASGKTIWLQTVKRPIFDENGQATQILGSATDITRRREAEFELALQRNELTHLSRVAMLGELSGSLAHELNQPLTAILSNAQAAQRFLAREKVDLDEVREILKDIVNDDKRAGEVISGLRLLLTKGEMQRKPLDVNDVVRDVLRLVRSDLLNTGVSVNTELAPFLPRAEGDRVQLQQVLINLVVNGCEAMAIVAAPARHLIVRTELSEERGVCVSVSDMGHGIPVDKLEHVFEPFFTTKTNGLGLGLAVCRTIISAQGGRLWAANNTERGATFHFTLPSVEATI